MADHFIKAYCSRSKQYYGMRVEDISGTLQVTDFYDIEENKAKMLASTRTISDLRTAANLRECFGRSCHNRKVGGCSCAKGEYECSAGQGYRYQCIYCSDLHVFTKEEGAEASGHGRVGEKITLAQGQEVIISEVGENALEHIRVGVGWDIALQGASMDVDSSVVVKSSAGYGEELIYYGNKTHPSGCVVHMGDNLVGGKYEGNIDAEDSENIDVYLKKVPSDRDQLYFVLNIYCSETRHQTFRDVRNMYIRLFDGKTRRVLVEYRVDNYMASKTGMIIAKTYRRGGNWMFQAIGKSVNVSAVDELKRYCND